MRIQCSVFRVHFYFDYPANLNREAEKYTSKPLSKSTVEDLKQECGVLSVGVWFSFVLLFVVDCLVSFFRASSGHLI